MAQRQFKPNETRNIKNYLNQIGCNYNQTVKTAKEVNNGAATIQSQTTKLGAVMISSLAKASLDFFTDQN